MQVHRTIGSAVALALACALAVSAAGGSASPAGPGERAKQTARVIAAGGPRVAGSAAELRADTYVAARFRRLGYRVTLQRFALPRGGTSRNVVARTAGRVRAIVVAHLDGVSAGPAANDNGSGVGTMLEVARVFPRTSGVIFAALGAEERFETGSRFHLGSLRLVRGISPARRPLVLSLDMVGVGPTLNVRGLEASPNRSARGALAVARRAGVRASYRQDTGQSDHAEFTRAGIPAAWIEWRWDPCWHSACDRAERLVPAKLAAAFRLTVEAVRGATRS
jgi:hypothetical protein